MNIAKGSCGELRTQLYIARKLDFLNKTDFDHLIGESKEISAMLHGLSTRRLKTRPVKSSARPNLNPESLKP